MKKLLTIDDLVLFCRENNFSKFSSKETGYKLAVQVPTTFEIDENVDDDHRGMLRLKFRIFHTGLNRNGSYVSEEAAKAAMPTIKNRPILAAIHQLDNGEWDFEAHNMEIIKNENGEEEIEYIEKQVGSFDESEPFFEYDKELDKTFVCGYGYISDEYTKANEIIKRKNGTKNSCELSIEELSYNAKENYLSLDKFYVAASTLLGSKKDGTEIGEGMLGSRADIADFSEKNNSVQVNINEELLNEIKKLNENLSQFNTKTSLKEGGTVVNKFEELLEKYGKSVEDIDFEYENLSDEELELKFEEVFGSDNTDGEDAESEQPASEGDESDETFEEESVSDSEEDNSEEEENDSIESDDLSEQDSIKPEKYSIFMSDGTVKEFSLTLDDITYAIYDLVNTMYADVDNTYYYVSVYEDNYVIMHDYWNGHSYKQGYAREGDNFTLVGDRIEVYANWLTKEEENALNDMRANYSAIESKLHEYQLKEENAQKDAMFVSEEYSSISDKEEFKALAENHVEFSVEELKNKLDSIILEYAKKGGLNFAVETENKGVHKVNLPIVTKAKNKPGRYGNLFKNKETE